MYRLIRKLKNIVTFITEIKQTLIASVHLQKKPRDPLYNKHTLKSV